MESFNAITSLEHHNATRQISEDYDNLNLFINEMHANFVSNTEQSLRSYNKARLISLDILTSIIENKKIINCNSDADVTLYSLIYQHLLFKQTQIEELNKRKDFNKMILGAISRDRNQEKLLEIEKKKLALFLKWYRQNEENCSLLYNIDCVEEYYKTL